MRDRDAKTFNRIRCAWFLPAGPERSMYWVRKRLLSKHALPGVVLCGLVQNAVVFPAQGVKCSGFG